MMYLLRKKIFGLRPTEHFLEAEREELRAAQQVSESESPADTYDNLEWIRTRTLEDEIMSVEEMRWLKRRRAILNYGNGTATESDLDCLSKEERDRLESIEIQVRWDQFLDRPKGVDVRPGRFFL